MLPAVAKLGGYLYPAAVIEIPHVHHVFLRAVGRQQRDQRAYLIQRRGQLADAADNLFFLVDYLGNSGRCLLAVPAASWLRAVVRGYLKRKAAQLLQMVAESRDLLMRKMC